MSSLRMLADHLALSRWTTAADLARAHHDGFRALSRLLLRLEQYEIAFTRFRTVRRHLAEEHRQYLETFSRFLSRISKFLPLTPEGGGYIPQAGLADPTSEDIAELKELQQAYGDACGDLTSYILDLQIEAQNELLGSLFDHTLPPRHPEDPDVKVLARDPDAASERPPGRLV